MFNDKKLYYPKEKNKKDSKRPHSHFTTDQILSQTSLPSTRHTSINLKYTDDVNLANTLNFQILSSLYLQSNE